MLETMKANTSANRAAAITQCVAQGGDLNTTDNGGWSPLHWAVVNGDLAAAEALVVAGANVNTRDGDGATPLATTMILNASDPDIAIPFLRLFAGAGADLNAVDEYNETPLSHATGFHAALPVVNALLAAGADPNIVLPNGRTALYPTIQAQCLSDIGIALLDAGADPTRMDPLKLDLFTRATRILCTDSLRDRTYHDRVTELVNK